MVVVAVPPAPAETLLLLPWALVDGLVLMMRRGDGALRAWRCLIHLLRDSILYNNCASTNIVNNRALLIGTIKTANPNNIVLVSNIAL